MHQVMFRKYDFQNANVAIQTVLTLHAQSRTTNVTDDSNDDETCNVPAYRGVTRLRGTERVDIARQNSCVSQARIL
ncbi:hypothetical protein EDB89DRAFT_1817874, partial [Lactarius sanguifluus]